MALSKHELEELIRLVGQTTDEELTCQMCLDLVAEFAEQKLANIPISDGLRRVEQHLAICGECREEFEALKRSLDKLDGQRADGTTN